MSMRIALGTILLLSSASAALADEPWTKLDSLPALTGARSPE